MTAPHCPWSTLDAGTVSFCEERLCAWIVEPSNTWSSLGYIILGVMMLANAIRPLRARLLAVAIAQLMIGIGSFFFHASGTFVGELVDQFGMFLLSGLILAFAAAQTWRWPASRTIAVYAGLVVVSTLSLLLVRPAGIPLFGVQLAAGLIWQVSIWWRGDATARRQHYPFFAGLGLFLVAFAIWIGDISGALCDPDNHLITGHAVWHVLNAFAVERLGCFYGRCFPASQT